MVDGDPDQRVSYPSTAYIIVTDDEEWENCGVKTFTFESEDDDDAKMVEIPANVTGVQDLFADLIGGIQMTREVPAKKEQVMAPQIMVQ
jgi:hypothetical protein